MNRILSIIIAGIGLALLLGGCWIIYESNQASTWPTTKGTIVESYLEVNHLPKILEWHQDPLCWYGVDIHYLYRIKGQVYFSKRLTFYEWSTRSSQLANQVLNKYRRMQIVPVYYDPQNPENAILEPAIYGDLFFVFIFGVLLTFVGFSFLLNLPASQRDWGIIRYIHEGNINQSNRKIDEAFDLYTQAIIKAPHQAIGYKNRGNLYFKEGYYDNAIIDFNKAVKLDPRDALICYNLGSAYLIKEDYPKAWEFIKKAERLGYAVKEDVLENIKLKMEQSAKA